MQKSNFCFKHLPSYFNSVVSQIIKMGWLLQCNIGSLRKHKPPVTCSISLSKNYVIVKPFSRNINRQRQSSVEKKCQSASPSQVFLSRPSLILWQRKVSKTHLLCDRILIYLSSLNLYYSEFSYINAAC